MRSLCLRDPEARTLDLTGECVIRRPVKPQPLQTQVDMRMNWWEWKPDEYGISCYSREALSNAMLDMSPLGQPGECRWCREKYFCWDGGASGMGEDVFFEGDPEIPKLIEDNNLLLFPRELSGGVVGKWRWRSPVTIPRWASRFIVEILSTEALIRDGVWYWTARVRRVEA